MKGGDSNGRISRNLDGFYRRSSRGSGRFIRAGPQVRDEATTRELQGGLTMTNQALAYVALVILAFALILTSHLLLSAVAVVPLILASFGDAKKAQRNR